MSILSFAKELRKKSPFLFSVACRLYNRTIGLNRISIRGKENRIAGLNGTVLYGSRINITGNGNTVTFGKEGYYVKSDFKIHGNNNEITIGKGVFMNDGDLFIEDNGNKIVVGENTTIHGKTHIAATEGTTISIGNDCMFSSEVVIRSGDSHSIVDGSGKRINQAENVTVGEHVWFGNRAMVLKGSSIASRSIVGTGAIVSGKFDQSGVVIAGVPAKVIKESIDWIRERI